MFSSAFRYVEDFSTSRMRRGDPDVTLSSGYGCLNPAGPIRTSSSGRVTLFRSAGIRSAGVDFFRRKPIAITIRQRSQLYTDSSNSGTDRRISIDLYVLYKLNIHRKLCNGMD